MKPWVGMVALLALVGCHDQEPAEQDFDVHQREAWDGPNAPEVFGNLQSMPYQELARTEYRQGLTSQRPWSDDYWPWIQGGLAKRWLLPGQAIDIDVNAQDYRREVQRKVTAFLDFAQRADDATRQRLSPIEKYDLVSAGAFPLTTKELLEYAEHLKYFEDNEIPWEWMGSCDGWALAALQMSAPLYPVLASTPGGQPVLFTVGDVRGLVSKAYTSNHKNRRSQLLGTRCEHAPAELAYDDQGRIVDGTLGRWRSGTLAQSRHIQILYNNWQSAGHEELDTDADILVFRYADDPEQVYWLRAVGWTERLKDIVAVEVRPLAPGGRLDTSVPAQRMDFRYLKACRDLNAGAFHLVLAQLLSQAAASANGGARGFVLEASRGDEVWNHPIYGYISRLGQPLDVQAIDPRGPQDPYAGYRAAGTRYLVHAYTTVYFGTENGPLVVYDENDDKLQLLTYQYTLELDDRGYVIGGEWHQASRQSADRLQPLSGQALLQFLAQQATRGSDVNAPDFLWRYPDDTRITSSCDSPPCMSPAIVYRLAACSRQTPRPGDVISFGGQSLPFVRCDL